MSKFSFNIPWSKFYALVIVCLLMCVTAYSSYTHLQSLYYERIEHNLKSQIGILHQSLSAWGRSKRSFVHSWARQPDLTRHAQIITENQNDSLNKLSQYTLTDYLRPVISDPEINHFYLVGPGNTVIASDAEETIGLSTPLMAFPYVLRQAWGGMGVITHPVRLMGQDHATIYVTAAVKDATSKPIALLILEVDPVISFNQVFKKSSFSETGEAYAFDRDGVMLTPGRGDLEIDDNVRPADVGAGTLLGELSALPVTESTTTPLAANIGRKDFELYVREPFLGRDGSQKIGAWVWDAQFQMGLALEQSADEGLELLRKMQWVFLSFISLVLLISLSFFFILSYTSAARTREEEKARKDLVAELQSLHENNTLEIADREAKHRAIIDTAWDAIFTVDSRGVILSGNPATARIFGCPQEKLVGHLLEDSIWLEGRDRFCPDYLARFSGQAVEATGIRYDRRAFPVTVSIAQTHTSQSAFFTVIVRDISEQKASETSLLNTQRRLEMSQSLAFIGTWEWDVRTDQVTATEMALKLNCLDVDRNPVGLGIFFSRINPEDRSALNQSIHQSITSREPFSVECRVQAEGASEEWLLIQGTPLLSQGSVNRVIGHIQRITERRENEKALLEAKNMLRLVLDTIPIGVYWKNTDLKIAGVNKRFCNDIGLPEADIIGKTERDVYQNTQQADIVARLDRAVIETGIPMIAENGRYFMNNGKLRHIEISRLPIQDQDSNTLGMLGVYTDVTERLETQKSLKRHHQLLASIYSSQLRYFAGDDRRQIFSTLLSEALSLSDSEYGFIGQVLYKSDGAPYLKTYSITDISWDEETQELYQRTRNDGMEFHNLETLFGWALKTGELVISNDPASDPRSRGLPHGHPAMHSFMGVPLLKGDQLVGMIGMANRDGGYDQEFVRFLQPMFTTCANLLVAIENDRKIVATQQQLLRAKNAAEKASRAKTEFLSRVSHELRTPMNAILGFTTLLTETVDDQEQRGFLEEIETAGDHLMNLINEVLDLERIESGRIELNSEMLSLDELIEECCSVTRQLAAQRQIQIQIAPESVAQLRVFADVGRLRQILLNLLSNAIKYNKFAGQVTIQASELSDGGVSLQVADTGVGISESDLEHLFESFNRLHAENSDIEGTGMGLVITRQLVELMGGRLEVSSVKDEGSTFTVSLPAEPPLLSGDAVAPERDGDGSPRVLIMSLQSGAEECCPELEASLAGYDLEFVDSGIAFLESALQHRYRIMICDVAVDDMGVDELLSYLTDADILPATPVVLMTPSGYVFSQENAGLTAEQAASVYQHIKGEPVGKLVQKLLDLPNRDQV